MTTITTQFDDTTKLQRILDFFKRLNVSFQILDPKNEPETLWEPHIHAIIQERLIEKYVKTGEWEKMGDEERQDASQLEKMLWQKEQADYHSCCFCWLFDILKNPFKQVLKGFLLLILRGIRFSHFDNQNETLIFVKN